MRLCVCRTFLGCMGPINPTNEGIGGPAILDAGQAKHLIADFERGAQSVSYIEKLKHGAVLAQQYPHAVGHVLVRLAVVGFTVRWWDLTAIAVGSVPTTLEIGMWDLYLPRDEGEQPMQPDAPALR